MKVQMRQLRRIGAMCSELLSSAPLSPKIITYVEIFNMFHAQPVAHDKPNLLFDMPQSLEIYFLQVKTKIII
jgi:hypothetical protein